VVGAERSKPQGSSSNDYKLMSKCLRGSGKDEENFSFFAVVVDASYPHKA
jgi:hypothetical protein